MESRQSACYHQCPAALIASCRLRRSPTDVTAHPVALKRETGERGSRTHVGSTFGSGAHEQGLHVQGRWSGVDKHVSRVVAI